MEAEGSDKEPCIEHGSRTASLDSESSLLLAESSSDGDCRSRSSLGEMDELCLAGDVTWREYWRFSLVMGCADILVDVDKYFIYFLLIQRVGCDFEASYGALYLVYTVAYLLWSPLTGFISDHLQNHIIYVMILCSSALLLVYVSLLTIAFSDAQLIVVYSLRCIVQMQLSSSSWKAIKVSIESLLLSSLMQSVCFTATLPTQMFVQLKFGSNVLLHEEAMNKIGTLGDLASEVYEIALMALALLSAMWKGDYLTVRWLMDIGVLLTCSLMLLPSISLSVSYGGSPYIFSAEQACNQATKESVHDSDTKGGSKEKLNGRTYGNSLLEFFTYRVRYFWGSVILTNCVCLSMVSSCFEYMFDGPITLTRAALSTTKHGLCGGAVDFIILQGLILQLLYLVGGVAYFTFIMKLHPSHYYGKIFPGMSIVFMIACGLQFIPMPEMVAAVTISTVTVLSYYMSIYNSYMLSGASRAELFGFVQAVYSAAVGLAGFLPSVLQLIKASQGTLMAVALVMATWGLLQSLYLYRRNFADHGRVKTVRE